VEEVSKDEIFDSLNPTSSGTGALTPKVLKQQIHATIVLILLLLELAL